jgi:hypothetical protein
MEYWNDGLRNGGLAGKQYGLFSLGFKNRQFPFLKPNIPAFQHSNSKERAWILIKKKI